MTEKTIPFKKLDTDLLMRKYDAFVFSVYGTLYEESDSYQDAVKLMEIASRKGKLIYIFTNTPLRQSQMMQVLKKRGVAPSFYQHIITAAEETYRHLQQRKDPWHASLGKKYYFIGHSSDAGMLDELPYQRVSSLDHSNFILVLNPNEWHCKIKDYQEMLNQALALDLPMVCANPDLFLVVDGEKTLQAGSIARYYESIGGEVYYHGKPYPSFFNRLRLELAPIPKEKTLLIGDSLLSDIKGATGFGYDSLLVVRNTTLHELKLYNQENDCSLDEISASIELMGFKPTYITKSLQS